jgi:hypothetical protein
MREIKDCQSRKRGKKHSFQRQETHVCHNFLLYLLQAFTSTKKSTSGRVTHGLSENRSACDGENVSGLNVSADWSDLHVDEHSECNVNSNFYTL